MDLAGDLPGVEVDETSFQFEDLLDKRPVKILIEHGRGGEGSIFQAAMAFVNSGDGLEIGRGQATVRQALFWCKQIADSR